MIVFRGGGNRGSNLGVLALSAPTTDFAQIRADKQREMQLLTMMADQNRYDRLSLQNSVTEQRNKYDQIRNLSFLTPDQNRINMVADGLEKQIQDKVRKQYGGNIQKYIEDGSADSDYRTFVAGIKNSDAFQKANSNKVNMATFIEDQKNGKTPMLVGGRPIQDVYADFMSGSVDSFNYGGGYKPPTDWAKRIQDSYGSDRFKKEAAPPQRVILEMIQDGLTQEQAIDYYTQAGLAKNPVYHKYDDAYDKQKFDEESALRQARTTKLLEPDATDPNKNAPYLSVREALGRTQGAEVNRTFMGAPQKFTVSAAPSKTEMDLALNYINGSFDQKSGFYTLPRGTALTTVDGTGSVNGISGFYNPKIVVKKDPRGPQYEELFLQVDGIMTEEDAQKNGSFSINGKKNSVENDGWINRYDNIGGSAVVKKVGLVDELLGRTDSSGAKYEIKDLLIPMGNNTVFGEASINDKYSIGPKASNPTGVGRPSNRVNPMSDLYNDNN